MIEDEDFPMDEEIPDEFTLFPKPMEVNEAKVEGDNLVLDIIIDPKDLDDLIERCESFQRLYDAIESGDHVERLAGGEDACFGEYLM